MSKNKHRIVIVGGGFAGVKTALKLAHDKRFHITLISEHTDFRIYGTLYLTATGGPKRISSIPLSELFADKAVHILHDRVTSLDRQAKTVTTAVGHTVGYDALVLALGVQTNYFNIKGLSKYSFGIKSPEQAQELKAHLHQQLIEEKHLDLNYVVVGGGPTGIELAGALPDYIHKISTNHGLGRRAVHIDLVEAAPRLLPRMPKALSRRINKRLRNIGVKIYVNTAVQAQTSEALMINNKPIRSHTVIWTAGIANNPLFTSQKFQLTKAGKVRVDQYLQAEAAIYVLGDNADTPYSGMAQTALHDGIFMANHLIRLADSKDPVPYKAKKPIYVFPAGPNWAAVLWGPVRMYGRFGWLLRRLADFVAFSDYEPLNAAINRAVSEDQHEETCVFCTDKLTKMEYLSGEV